MKVVAPRYSLLMALVQVHLIPFSAPSNPLGTYSGNLGSTLSFSLGQEAFGPSYPIPKRRSNASSSRHRRLAQHRPKKR